MILVFYLDILIHYRVSHPPANPIFNIPREKAKMFPKFSSSVRQTDYHRSLFRYICIYEKARSSSIPRDYTTFEEWRSVDKVEEGVGPADPLWTQLAAFTKTQMAPLVSYCVPSSPLGLYHSFTPFLKPEVQPWFL